MDEPITKETDAATGDGQQHAESPGEQHRRELFRLPGLMAIALYLSVLAGVIILGAVSGNYPPLFLLFSALFFAASGGLLLLFRWAWALALAAVLMLAAYNSWIFSTERIAPALVQGLLNWVFFLYMIRVEVRSKLR